MTIEERIETIMSEEIGNLDHPSFDLKYEIEAALERIATEQKAEYDSQLPLIKETYYNAGYETAKNKMIDKACEYLRKEYQQMNAIINRLCIKDKGDLIKVEASVESFRKAMEV